MHGAEQLQLTLVLLAGLAAGIACPSEPPPPKGPALLVEAAAGTRPSGPVQAWLWTNEGPRLLTVERDPGAPSVPFRVAEGCAASGTVVLLGAGVMSEPIEIAPEACGEAVVTVRFLPAGMLTGTTRSAGGDALPSWGWIDATPCGDPPQPARRFPFVLGDDGSFALSLPAGCVDAVLRAPGFAPVRVPAVEITPSTSTPLGRIELRAGAWIEARAISAEDGKPLPRTVVRAVPESEWGKAFCAQTEGSFAPLGAGFQTGPGGWVTLTGLSSGLHLLAAESPDHAPALFGPIDADSRGTRVDPLELGRPGRITVSVPALAELVLAGVPVRLRAYPALLPEEAKSCFVLAPVGADGKGTLQGLAPGTWQVGIVVVGPAGLEFVGKQEVVLRSGEDLETTMDLSGRVVFGKIERRGKPARCHIALRRTRDFFSSVAHSGRSGDDGVFAMLVAEPDVYTLELDCAQPRLRSTVPEVKVALDGKELRIAIPDAEIGGTVFDRAGRPLAGYDVQARLRVTLEAGTSRQRSTEVMALAGPTDETGAFVLDGLARGRWALNAAREGRRCSAVREVDLGDDDTLAGVVLRVEQGPRLAGRVTASGGAGVARASLRLTVALPNTVEAAEMLAVATDDRGAFAYDLGPGAADVVNIGASARGFPAAAFRVAVEEGLVLPLPSQGGMLEIEGPRGESFAWARPLVLVNEVGGFLLLGDLEASPTRAPLTGANLLTVGPLAPGLWRLARMDDRASALVALSGAGFGLPGPVARVSAGSVSRIAFATPAAP